MTGFEKRAKRKKDSIRKAGLELFSRLGVKKVTIHDIARSANVSPVSIYNYFNSKDELIQDIVKTTAEEAIEETREMIRSSLPFPEKLEKIIFRKSQSALLFQGKFFQYLIENDSTIHDFYENEFKVESRELMEEFFREGKETGFIDSELSDAAIFLYISIFRKGLEQSPALMQNLNSVTEEAIRIFFRGFVVNA